MIRFRQHKPQCGTDARKVAFQVAQVGQEDPAALRAEPRHGAIPFHADVVDPLDGHGQVACRVCPAKSYGQAEDQGQADHDAADDDQVHSFSPPISSTGEWKKKATEVLAYVGRWPKTRGMYLITCS